MADRLRVVSALRRHCGIMSGVIRWSWMTAWRACEWRGAAAAGSKFLRLDAEAALPRSPRPGAGDACRCTAVVVLLVVADVSVRACADIDDAVVVMMSSSSRRMMIDMGGAFVDPPARSAWAPRIRAGTVAEQPPARHVGVAVSGTMSGAMVQQCVVWVCVGVGVGSAGSWAIRVDAVCAMWMLSRIGRRCDDAVTVAPFSLCHNTKRGATDAVSNVSARPRGSKGKITQ